MFGSSSGTAAGDAQSRERAGESRRGAGGGEGEQSEQRHPEEIAPGGPLRAGAEGRQIDRQGQHRRNQKRRDHAAGEPSQRAQLDEETDQRGDEAYREEQERQEHDGARGAGELKDRSGQRHGQNTNAQRPAGGAETRAHLTTSSDKS